MKSVIRNKSKKLLILFALVLIVCNANAQVGIGTISPDSKVVLDIKSIDKGILIPRMRAETAIKKEGSLIYDTIAHKYKFCFNDEWISVNPLNADAGDNVTATGDLTISNNLTTNGTTVNASNAIVTAKTFVGNGTIPIGGIIMWSGNITDIPNNWKLCDGANGRPDLRGKFVEGYDPRKADFAIRDSGGYNQITLTTDNLPIHNHEKGTLNSLNAGEHKHDYYGYRAVDNGGGEHVKSRNKISTDPKDYGGELAGIHAHQITGLTANAGGEYTYNTRINPAKLYLPFECFAYECSDNYGENFYANRDLSNYASQSNIYYDANNDNGYTGGYKRFVLTRYDISNDSQTDVGYFISNYSNTYFTIDNFTCSENSNQIYYDYINPDWDPAVAEGGTIVYNEKWTVLPFDNRPAYYVLAYIIRIE